MATFRKVQQSIKYVKYSDAKPGDVLVEGVYVSTDLVDSFDKSSKVPQHRFLDADNNVVALNSAGQLNFLLTQVSTGSIVRVTFLGKEKIKNKKTGRIVEANQFEVETADDLGEIENEAESA